MSQRNPSFSESAVQTPPAVPRAIDETELLNREGEPAP